MNHYTNMTRIRRLSICVSMGVYLLMQDHDEIYGGEYPLCRLMKDISDIDEFLYWGEISPLDSQGIIRSEILREYRGDASHEVGIENHPLMRYVLRFKDAKMFFDRKKRLKIHDWLPGITWVIKAPQTEGVLELSLDGEDYMDKLQVLGAERMHNLVLNSPDHAE